MILERILSDEDLELLTMTQQNMTAEGRGGTERNPGETRAIASRDPAVARSAPRPRGLSGFSTPSSARGKFPRSRTMQLLASSRGLGAVGAVVVGLLSARPGLAWRLIRLLPTRALARSFLLRWARSPGCGAKGGE